MMWADRQTRQRIADAVSASMTHREHLAVRHVLDRNALRGIGTRADYLQRLDEALRVDAMNEEYPL